ncbi:MAG: MBL fold metallo-hydrolase [Clostridiales bacterium]|nr:MBL fold metallo-hydrolase [Clostridiales bacterium]
MKLRFCGADTGVTGSCHLVTTEHHKILLDCGQFQGNKTQEARNFEEFPFNPAEVEAVVLSHAHIDHCGRLPLLVKRGFKGKIYCTDATADLLDIMLKDSAYIHEQEAEWQNRKNMRAGKPLVEPLFTADDALTTLELVRPVLYDQLIKLNDEIDVCFNDAGHILGSAIIELFIDEAGEKSKLVFSGDLGMNDKPILRDPTIIKKADYVIMETTYGDRDHESTGQGMENLMHIVQKTIERGGNVVIPSFAVGRTQELVYEFNRIYEERPEYKKLLDKVYVYVDSPMAVSATDVFRNNAQVFDEETKAYILKGDNPLDFKNLRFTKTADESRALNFDTNPKIIISASGMCEAGRIKHHLKHNLWNPKSSIVFVGYQAAGTLGRSISDGAEEVTLFGEKIKVAAEVYDLDGFSGHADRGALLTWLKGFQKKPSQIFLVHGEEESKRGFASLVQQELDWATTPVYGPCEVELNKDEPLVAAETPQRILDPEELEKIKERIDDVRSQLEAILTGAHGAVKGTASAERIIAINNAILELEKNALNLGSTFTAEDRKAEEQAQQQ